MPEFSDSYDQFDAGVQYSINNHIVVTVDAVNLTNSKEFTYANFAANTQAYREVGRRYTVGIRGQY